MFPSCSEITTSVIVKHVEHVGIIRAFCLHAMDVLSFSVPGGTEKIVGLWFAKGDQYPGWHYGDVHFFYFRSFLQVLSKSQFGILMLPD